MQGAAAVLARGPLLARLAPAPAAVSAAAPGAAVLTASDAARLVRRWQAAKADALGPQHALGALSTSLGGPLLQEWQSRAEDVRAQGWHYSHDLVDAKVRVVRAGPSGAVVRAELKETVTVHRGGEAAAQTFRSDYTVDYTLSRLGGRWLITQAAVQA